MTEKKAPQGGLVFVYGTLKQGFRLHSILKDCGARFVCEAMTKKAGFALDTANELYPGLVLGNYRIKGEVYKVDADTMAVLDEVEGHPELFERVGIKLKNFKGLVHVYAAGTRLARMLDKDTKSECISTDKKTNVQEWIGHRNNE